MASAIHDASATATLDDYVYPMLVFIPRTSAISTAKPRLTEWEVVATASAESVSANRRAALESCSAWLALPTWRIEFLRRRAENAPVSIWPRGVTVSTLDSESSDRGSNPREAFL